MNRKYKYFIYLMSFFIVLILLFFFHFNSLKSFRVAHAGGEYNSLKYSNSIAAMYFNSKYTRYIELDLQLTKDNRLVCIHDPLMSNKYFNEVKQDPKLRVRLNSKNSEFPDKDFCYDESLKEFLEQNQDVIIITDFKTDNLKGLNFIKNYFEQSSERFIPQIYNEKEYLPVKNLGYKDVIFTLYRVSHYSNEKIAQIIQSLDLFGLTMDPPRLRSGIADKIQNKDFLIYVHTVNSYLRFLQYKIFFGADEIYTDNLF